MPHINRLRIVRHHGDAGAQEATPLMTSGWPGEAVVAVTVPACVGSTRQARNGPWRRCRRTGRSSGHQRTSPVVGSATSGISAVTGLGSKLGRGATGCDAAAAIRFSAPARSARLLVRLWAARAAAPSLRIRLSNAACDAVSAEERRGGSRHLHVAHAGWRSAARLVFRHLAPALSRFCPNRPWAVCGNIALRSRYCSVGHWTSCTMPYASESPESDIEDTEAVGGIGDRVTDPLACAARQQRLHQRHANRGRDQTASETSAR